MSPDPFPLFTANQRTTVGFLLALEDAQNMQKACYEEQDPWFRDRLEVAKRNAYEKLGEYLNAH